MSEGIRAFIRKCFEIYRSVYGECMSESACRANECAYRIGEGGEEPALIVTPDLSYVEGGSRRKEKGRT